MSALGKQISNKTVVILLLVVTTAITSVYWFFTSVSAFRTTYGYDMDSELRRAKDADRMFDWQMHKRMHPNYELEEDESHHSDSRK